MKQAHRTFSGMPVKRVYTPRDLSGIDYKRDLGMPGRFPFTRGVYSGMHRDRLWTMRQYTGFAGAEETNRRFKYLIAQGQTGLSVAFDLPTQLGRDSDSPEASGEVGRVGVPVSSLKDMEVLMDGIPLDEVSTSMTINATAPTLLAMYVAIAEKQGVPYTSIRGTVQNDILKEYAARNTYIYPPGPSLRLLTDVIEYCARSLPKWHPISISGYHMREAGADAVQELAFTLSNAIEYVRACLRRGLRIDEFAPGLSFFFACRTDLFEEVAKFRAARRIWARIMREEFRAKNHDSWRMRFHVQTSGETLTAQQPENNVIRVTLQALAAVLGGAQSLHTNSRDEALSLPTEESVKIALRTQQIIAYESGVTNTVDPLGGSYFLERLTSELEARVKKEMKRVERMGGALKAVESGYIQRAIRENAYRHQVSVEGGKTLVVGMNMFEEEEKPELELHRIDPEAERGQLRRLREVKASRDSSRVRRVLEKLRVGAADEGNLMPVILEAVKAYATLGEVSDVLREVFGEYRARTAL